MFIYDLMLSALNWLWGLPMLFVLVGGGVFLTFTIGGIQFTKFFYIMKQTIGSAFKPKNNGEGISGYSAVAAALSSTVGTGNIVGVGSAIAMGGPGAVFWMWVIGFVAMATKYCEVVLSVKYREPKAGGGWLAGPFMYIKKGIGSSILAYTWAVGMLVACLIGASLHTGSTLDGLETLSVPRVPLLAVIVVVTAFVVFGGVKRLVSITDKFVPIMSALYIIGALIIIILNADNFLNVISLIFSSAFTGSAASGGFTGATIAMTIRWGVARGAYSNDAGGGIPTIIHGQADCNHPVEQGFWGVFEVFVDTILICSCTAFAILITGEHLTGAPGSVLAINAFGTGLGTIGAILAPVGLALFAISTIMALSTFVKLQSEITFGATISKLVSVLYLVMVCFGMYGVDIILPFSDLSNAMVILCSLPSVVFLHKVIKSETKDYFENYSKQSK